MTATYEITYRIPKYLTSPDVQNRARGRSIYVRLSAGAVVAASPKDAVAKARRIGYGTSLPILADQIRAKAL